MKVTEQIDALRTLATHPVDYLVVPRLLALVIALPLLTVEAVAVGIGAALLPGARREALMLTLALTPTAWAAIATLAIVSTALAFVAFLSGLAVLGPVRTAIVSTIEPFWAALLGAIVLHQPLGWPTLAGGGAIAGAVLMLQLPQREASPESNAPLEL